MLRHLHYTPSSWVTQPSFDSNDRRRPASGISVLGGISGNGLFREHVKAMGKCMPCVLFEVRKKQNNEIDSLFSFVFIFFVCLVIIFVVQSGCKWRANLNQPQETATCPPQPLPNRPCNMEWMYNVMNKITFLVLQMYFFTFAGEIRCDKTQFPGTFCCSHNWWKWHLVFLSSGTKPTLMVQLHSGEG